MLFFALRPRSLGLRQLFFGIPNAFRLTAAGGPPICLCPGDLDTNGQVDLQDLDAPVNLLVNAGPPFIVPCEWLDSRCPMLDVRYRHLAAANSGPVLISLVQALSPVLCIANAGNGR